MFGYTAVHFDCYNNFPILQEATNLLEKRLKLIASLCEERKELGQKERAVTLSKCSQVAPNLQC